jgi:hypothetical protein
MTRGKVNTLQQGGVYSKHDLEYSTALLQVRVTSNMIRSKVGILLQVGVHSKYDLEYNK